MSDSLTIETRPLRRDAARNRDSILAAAQDALAERGLDVAVDEVARRAGVGMGTLYRHFPTKDALIEAVLLARFEELTARTQAALDQDDGWEGLATFFRHAVGLQARDRGFRELMASRLRQEPRLAAARARLAPLIEELIERARVQGALRPELRYEDLVMVLAGCGRIVEAMPEHWERYAAIALAGMRASACGSLPGEPPSRDELERSMSGR
jgi:AcrR family transcriptional regulator